MASYLRIIIVLTALVSGCAIIDLNDTQYKGSDVLGIAFFQGGTQVVVEQAKNGVSVPLGPKPFDILVPYVYKAVAVQICAFENSNVFKQFSLDKKLNYIPCFSSGTGLAVAHKPSNNRFDLYLTDGLAHNYFHILRSTNGVKYRRIGIDSIVESKDTTNQPVYDEFYMVVFMDKNNDKVMSENEVEYFFFSQRPVKK